MKTLLLLICPLLLAQEKPSAVNDAGVTNRATQAMPTEGTTAATKKDPLTEEQRTSIAKAQRDYFIAKDQLAVTTQALTRIVGDVEKLCKTSQMRFNMQEVKCE